MTLDEAISHAEEVAEEQEKYCPTPEGVVDNHKKCAEEHRQLAEWLKDYKRLKEEESSRAHQNQNKNKYDGLTPEIITAELSPYDMAVIKAFESTSYNIPGVNMEEKNVKALYDRIPTKREDCRKIAEIIAKGG